MDIGGQRNICHVKNTGRCSELLIPGAEVWLSHAADTRRKTEWDLIAVQKGEHLINMDAQAPNKVFAEWAAVFDPNLTKLRQEYAYGQSRLDFLLETNSASHLVEVKGVTLEENGHACFPDAPTERGIKHLYELIRAADAGYRASIVFVVQMEHAVDFSPNEKTHPAFAAALRQAVAAGVDAIAVNCHVTPDSLTILHRIPVHLTTPLTQL